MTRNRLEAFSDGVIAILITIMVLELKVPHGSDLTQLLPLVPVFLSYVLSFLYLGIYWNNHHHMLHLANRINGKVLWANMHLLFWLSLIPFVTAWSGENHFETMTVVAYAFVLLMCGAAYYILEQMLIAAEGKDSALAKAVGNDRKGIASLVLYILSIAIAFYNSQAAMAVIVIVAIMWIVPDTRIEKHFNKR